MHLSWPPFKNSIGDFMKIFVTDLTGKTTSFEPEEDWSLMEAIRDSGLHITAECGGALACATCHVYVDSHWVGRLEQPSEDEREMLEEARDPKSNSRLSCQVMMTPELDGLQVTIAPDFD